MPFYEYLCRECGCITGRFRKIKSRKRTPKCEECKARTDLTWSTPSVNVWSDDWKFPNLSPHGDGTMKFKNEGEYKKHLKDIGADVTSLGIREV